MTFDSVYHMLLWFFNRLWQRGPKQLGNNNLIFIKGGLRYDDVRDIWSTVWSISKIIDKLPRRDREIIKDLFTRHVHISDVAKKMKLTERRIRQVRRQTLNLLQHKCLQAGIICEEKYDTPVYL